MRALLHRNVLTTGLDASLALISFPAALYLRLSMRAFSLLEAYIWPASLSFALLMSVMFLSARSYRRIWRYTSLADLISLVKIGTFGLMLFYIGLFQFTRLEDFPRSVILIHWMMFTAMLVSVRLAARLMSDRALLKKPQLLAINRTPVVLIGAGSQAEMFIRSAQQHSAFPYEPVAIIDDEPRALGSEIRHVRIYGPLSDCTKVIEKFARQGVDVARLILCDDGLSAQQKQSLLDVASAHKILLSRLPRLSDLGSDGLRVSIQNVAVEDILGRSQAALDEDAIDAMIRGKRVLITGAGGSIGSELVRQIAQHHPASILCFELSEYLLYEISQELSADYPEVIHRSVIGDVRDHDQLARVMAEYKPEMVFHAAALKHVPMAEHNASQAVLTNALGTSNVAACCRAVGVATLVQISTDKAVNPTSLMGATKRLGEMIAQAHAQEASCSTRMVTVRFGNVLGSNGSVVPLFQRQIARGGPVTVTHPDMTRYLMTIGEAVGLVLQAAVLAHENTKERAPIFVLEMGAPVKILDLAVQMIRLAGRTPYSDIAIEFTGIRPGEKLYEELFYDAENLQPTTHRSIRKAAARLVELSELEGMVARLIAYAKTGEDAPLRALLMQIVPEYTPETTTDYSLGSAA